MPTLSTETSAFLEGFAQVFASIDHLLIPEQRAAIKKLFQIPENSLPPILKVENKTITGKAWLYPKYSKIWFLASILPQVFSRRKPSPKKALYWI